MGQPVSGIEPLTHGLQIQGMASKIVINRLLGRLLTSRIRNFHRLTGLARAAPMAACTTELPTMQPPTESFGLHLWRWKALQGIGKKPRTQHFHSEIVGIIRAALPEADLLPRQLTDQTITELGQRLSRFCPSRYNGAVSAIRFATGNQKALKYRKLRFKAFRPLTQQEFAALLAECDKAPRSLCGLTVRFLSLTGLRINEARQVQWRHIHAKYIELPASITKNGLPRSIPLLPGAREVIDQLRQGAISEFVLAIPSMRTALRNACVRAGVPRLSNHSFRHIFATKAIEAGVDLPTLARWLGHVDGGALLSKMYFHLASAHSLAMAAKVVIQL